MGSYNVKRSSPLPSKAVSLVTAGSLNGEKDDYVEIDRGQVYKFMLYYVRFIFLIRRKK